jgi:lysophospholipase L1-like esterase
MLNPMASTHVYSILILSFFLLGCFSGTINLLNYDYVDYIGRFDFSTGQPRCDWSGSTIRLNIFPTRLRQNTDLNITFNNYQNGTAYFAIYLDEVEYGVYEIAPNVSDRIDVSFDSLAFEEHSLSLVKRTEPGYSSSFKIMEISSISIENAKILPVSKDPSLRFLFIGDSNTVAYGVDGISPCSFTADTQNIMHSYAAIVSSEFQAEPHFIAWSGKGVVRNYGDSNQVSVDPMPYYYNRTIALDASTYWDPSKGQFTPDLVFIMLGSNDYSTDPVPTDEQFVTGLTNLVKQVQHDYPNAIITTACEPHQRLNQCSNIKSTSLNMSLPYIAIPSSIYDGGSGCDGHPNYQSQINIANLVIPFFKSLLNVERQLS